MRLHGIGALALAVLLVGCAGENGTNSSSKCDPSEPSPDLLSCTGLYADIGQKQLALAARAYTPAVSFWSDGAVKSRWIELPEAEAIDVAAPNDWRFPVGTKLWKEFQVAGQRVETRLLHKQQAGYWSLTTYAWNADQSEATRSPGGEVTLADGSSYPIPSASECELCHRGRTDRALGFEQVSLGLSGADGLTLKALAEEALILPIPPRVELQLGDDGTGLAAPALSWLHINCGVACHNGNSTATAYGVGMHLRLDVELLDGGPSKEFETLTTTMSVPAVTAAWSGQPRIAPGDPDSSLLYRLIRQRGAQQQMPPIATLKIDSDGSALVGDWIRALEGAR